MKVKFERRLPILNNKINYEKETRLAYRNASKAKSYKEQLSERITWAHFTMWRERQCVEKALQKCNLNNNSRILDTPCGTGILANVLNRFPASIVACDIAREMMALAKGEYRKSLFKGFIQADIIKMPFKSEAYDCVIVLGFMHRVPFSIRARTLKEVTSLSKKFIIVSYSIDSTSQRLKHWLLKKIWTFYKAAPSLAPLRDIFKEFDSCGLIVRKMFRVVFFLSAEMIFLLEKNDSSEKLIENME